MSVVLGCLGLAAVSLLLPTEPTYDPWAWIVWGREILHGDLDTLTGPSWKPLPILFTTPFAAFGEAAPQLWVMIARAGGLLAIAMTFRLAARLAGPAAGAIAAAGLLLADEFVRNFARGNSEGLLVALCLWAVERHLDGKRRHAFVLGVAAGLLRPEVWPFLAAYGLWMMVREPRARSLVAGAGAVTLVAWFVPEWIGSGDWLRAASRAREANLDSPAYAARPFLEVFRLSAPILALPLLAGTVVAVIRLRRDRVVVALAAAAAVLMVAVAAMTEVGFAGNLRYVALPAALACVLSGAGWVALVGDVRRRAGASVAAVAALVLAGASAPLLAGHSQLLGDHMRFVRSEADFVAQLDRAVGIAGGPEAVRRCQGVFTARYQVPSVAWSVSVHLREVEIFPFGAGTALAPRHSALSRDPRYARVGQTTKWIVGRACA